MNIEGLAQGPKDSLLIGFRNPLVGSKAMVIPFQNPKKAFQGKKPKFKKPHLLDLDGLGIRGMAFAEEGTGPKQTKSAGYWIIAGSIGNEDQFRLYFWEWSNFPKSKKTKLIDLGKLPTDLKPESIAPVPNQRGKVLLISDDGRRMLSGKECKELDASKAKFRGVILDFSE